MKRRTVLLKSISGAAAAVVYTATGWLMGTRTLTMPGNGQWEPWVTETQCTEYGVNCGCYNDVFEYCDYHGPCYPGTFPCYKWDIEHSYCCYTPDPEECRYRIRAWPCGSCTSAAQYDGGTC